MARNARTQVDGVWNTSGYEVTKEDLEDLDRKCWRSVNGDRGGTYRLTGDVTIGSEGLNLTGPLDVWYGGEVSFGVNGLMRLGDGDYPTLEEGHALRSRTLVSTAANFFANPALYLGRSAPLGTPPVAGASDVQMPSQMAVAWKATSAKPYAGAHAWAVQVADYRTGEATSARVAWQLRVHDGATLSKVAIWFRIPQARQGGPQTPAKVRVVARDASGVVTILRSTTADANGNVADDAGWVKIPQVGAEEWMANGLAQSFDYFVDQNATIDVATKAYWVEVQDEQCDANQAYPLRRVRKERARVVATSNQATTGTPTIDGLVTAAGMRALLTAQTAPAENGIWVVAAGAWARASDDDSIEKRSLGELVGAASGVEMGGTIWERTSLPGAVGTGQTWALAVPTGNVWHSAEAFFTNIVDLRYQ